MSDEVVSKGAFAVAVGVVPGRVSQWISAGQLDGEALVGEGRSAKIRVAVAVQQLRDRLDLDRRLRATAKAQLDGIASVRSRPIISEASLQRLASKLSEAFLNVLRREFDIVDADPDGEEPR